MSESILTNVDFWRYLSIPVVAAFVGWSTNWIAIKLLFYPIEPIGKPPYLGWQGILPSKAAKMGAITADTTLSKLGTLKDVFESMQPQRIADHLVNYIESRLDAYVEWIMLEEHPKLWNSLPGIFKSFITNMVRQKLPETVHTMMDDISEHIEDLVDIKQLVIDQVTRDKRIINRIFLECGKVEFRFIIISGLYFGFPFGVIQMAVWYFYPAWWILPLFGVIVGYATNWIALRIIFQPLEPKKIGPFVIQGLFLKRQKEVAEIWCDIVTKEVITVHNIMDAVLNGPKSENTHRLIQRYIKELVDSAVGVVKPVAQLALTEEDFDKIQMSASEKALLATSSAFDDPEFTAERARIVKGMIQERMEKLPPVEFQNLLRPAFQEDEMKLILLGAALGFAAGMAQLFFVFGGI